MKTTTTTIALSLEQESYYTNKVVAGKAQAGLKKAVKDFFTANLSAAEAAGVLSTLVIPYDKLVKELINFSGNVTAKSLDLHAIMQQTLFEIASNWKNAGKNRIPVLKTQQGTAARLVTVRAEFFDAYYSDNTLIAEKGKQAAAKAKETKEAKAAKAAADSQELEEFRKGKRLPDGIIKLEDVSGPQATLFILKLLQADGVDLAAVQRALDSAIAQSVKKEVA